MICENAHFLIFFSSVWQCLDLSPDLLLAGHKIAKPGKIDVLYDDLGVKMPSQHCQISISVGRGGGICLCLVAISVSKLSILHRVVVRQKHHSKLLRRKE